MSLRIGILYLWAALLLQVCGALSAQAQLCSDKDKPQCDECYQTVCTKSADDKRPLWDCQPKTAGKVCDTGQCDGKGVCIGVPGTPGGIKGPSTSATGSFVLSWGPSTGVVDKYVLYQNEIQIVTGDQSVVSRSLLVRSDGAYRYHVQACNSAGCSAATPDLIVTVLLPPAQLCSGTKPQCDECNEAVCTKSADDKRPLWDCQPKTAGKVCDTGHCDGKGVCIGVPGTPGGIKGPSTSATRSFFLSWGPSTGVVDKYVLYQNGAQIFTGDKSVVSRGVLVQSDGAYRYHVQACNSAGCSAATPDLIVTVHLPPAQLCSGTKPTCEECNVAVCVAADTHYWDCVPKSAGQACKTGDACYKNGHCDGQGVCIGTLSCVPGTPGAIKGPSNSATGSFVLSWGPSTGVVDKYVLYQNGAQSFTGDQSVVSRSVLVQTDGAYNYHVQACNSAGCSPATPDFLVTVLLPPAEARTSYTYDKYGNLSTEQVAARDAATQANFPPATRGLVTLPAKSYTYSTDGYFRASATDSLGHTSSQIIDAATGLVMQSQSVQGGPVTTYVYDALGRRLTTKTDGTQPIEERLAKCSAGDNCVLRRQHFQSGAPVTTEYIDRLGRVIANGAEGFDGLEIISKIDYNARGAKIADYPPMQTTVTPGQWDGVTASSYPTRYTLIDALGRPGTKSVERNATALFQDGRGDAVLTTNYKFRVVDVGLRTDIEVTKAASIGGSLQMSRTYDRLGKLVETTEKIYAPAHEIHVNYFYDPAGDVVTVRDSAGNSLSASYDALSRKTSVDDPDRGRWQYSWDGLGRLRTQTDARGIVVAFQYDADGRTERRFTRDNDGATFITEANWQYDLNNKPGTLGALVGSIDGFRRDYAYDSLFRPWRIIYHIPASPDWTSHDFEVDYGYDHNYGRVKAISYPGGELTALDYDSRGTSIGESIVASDGTRGAMPYRRVTAQSERGQITAQTFGNGISETDSYDASTGMPLSMAASGLADALPAGCPTDNPLLVRQVAYSYDQFLNVASQTKHFLPRDSQNAIQFSGCTASQLVAAEAYNYDDLQRLLSATRNWQGVAPDPNTSLIDTYAYDDLGNIISKSDYGQVYIYGDKARGKDLAGPHAVVSVSNNGTAKASFKYDLNGNLIDGDGRNISFDSLDRPVQVSMGGYTTQFRYAPDGERYVQSAKSSTGVTNEYYFAKLYERLESPTSLLERTYVSDPVTIVRTGASREVLYRHLDRLGSLDAVTTERALEDPGDAHGYDAFGKPRAKDWQSSSDKMRSQETAYTSERGFTGHEHLDELYLIHMNGRMYDYRLGRFLSVDPIISNPLSSQSVNPYSYIGNNPLSGIDPTGYKCDAPTGTNICSTPTENVPFLGANRAPATIEAHGWFQNGSESQGVKSADKPTAEQGGPEDSGNKTKDESSMRSTRAQRSDAAEWSDPFKEKPSPPPMVSAATDGRPEKVWLTEQQHNDQVLDRIQQYRAASRSDYEAWDRAREDYRQIRLNGGDPTLRDAEHFLFRYWIASLGGDYVSIPNNLHGVAELNAGWNPNAIVNSFIVQNINDVFYNAIRPTLEKHFDITPTTPSMFEWEFRGFEYGYVAAGRPDLSNLVRSSQSAFFDWTIH